MPTWLLAENVRGALSDGTVDEVVAELLTRFPCAGYWLVDCSDLWLPQARVRVIIWAGPRELPELPIRYGPKTPAGLALGLWGVLDGGRNSDANPTAEPAQTVGTRGNLMLGPADKGPRLIGGGGNPHGPGREHERNHRDLTNCPSTTIAAQSGGGAGNAGPWVVPSRTVSATEAKGCTVGYDRADGRDRANRASDDLFRETGRRRLTVAECATLQGFPDGWPWQGNATQRYRQVGNAVPPVLAEACWRHVIEHDTVLHFPTEAP